MTINPKDKNMNDHYLKNYNQFPKKGTSDMLPINAFEDSTNDTETHDVRSLQKTACVL